MHRLIDDIFRPAFAQFGAAILAMTAQCSISAARGLPSRPTPMSCGRLFFPGGDIGTLAVNGTVNDLAMCGARPLYLSAGFVLEEGLPIGDAAPRRRIDARGRRAAGVRLVTGDTKVVERGKGDGLYLTPLASAWSRRGPTLARQGSRR